MRQEESTPEFQRLMAIVAHPGDAEFTCGGTPGLWAGQGAEISCLVCSDGSKGQWDPALSPEQLRDVRKTEQRAAADVLGVKEVVFLDYPDGELSREAPLERELVLWLRTDSCMEEVFDRTSIGIDIVMDRYREH